MTPVTRENTSLQVQNGCFVPVRIIEIELSQSILPVLSAIDEQTGMFYPRAFCVVRLHTQPLGSVALDLDGGELLPNEYLPSIWRALGTQINLHLRQDGLQPITGLDASLFSENTPLCMVARLQFLVSAPFVSVIVPTHNRPERLVTCVNSLLALQYPHFEIIVVDNAPSTNATADLIQQCYAHVPHLRYICEPRPGPSWARNTGIEIARGEILAFADDDVVVDPYWLAELVRSFYLTENVACVSGLVLPLKLDTPAQSWFEEYGGFQKGFSRRFYDMAQHRAAMPLYPYNAGSLGVGASMAFTAQFLRRLGGFDPVLGSQGPVRSGEDISAFFQVIMRGYTMVYEPAALLYHLHRQDYDGLLKQIYSYGVGQTAYLTRNVVEEPHLLLDFISKVPYGLFFLLSNHSSKNKKKSTHYPRELTLAELQGMLYGPLAYLQGRKHLQKVYRADLARASQEHSYLAIETHV